MNTTYKCCEILQEQTIKKVIELLKKHTVINEYTTYDLRLVCKNAINEISKKFGLPTEKIDIGEYEETK